MPSRAFALLVPGKRSSSTALRMHPRLLVTRVPARRHASTCLSSRVILVYDGRHKCMGVSWNGYTSSVIMPKHTRVAPHVSGQTTGWPR